MLWRCETQVISFGVKSQLPGWRRQNGTSKMEILGGQVLGFGLTQSDFRLDDAEFSPMKNSKLQAKEVERVHGLYGFWGSLVG